MDPQTSASHPGRNGLAALAFATIVAVQVVVPIVQLPKSRPAHFGWQMFCDLRQVPRYWMVRADGGTQEVDLAEHIGVRRLDADYPSVLPDYLLQAYPEAVAVRWQWPNSEEIEEKRWVR